MCVLLQNELSDDELQASHPIRALLQTLLPWVYLAGSGLGGSTQEQRNAALLEGMPGLGAFLEQHGVQLSALGEQASQEDRSRLAELVQLFMMQEEQQQ